MLPLSANGAWEDGLDHVAHVAAHSVVACHCALVVFTWVRTCCAGVVVVDHVIHAAAHSVVACCCLLAVFTWASTWCTGVVVVHVAAMLTAVVPNKPKN